MYLVKTAFWLRWIYRQLIWRIPQSEKVIYLTFDDGPHPCATPFVLDTLKQYNAKASFFCIGKNVVAEPAIYQQILSEGHRVGNHTQHHLNGWKVNSAAYLADIFEASKLIKSNLFRPPYGRIKRSQISSVKKLLSSTKNGEVLTQPKIIMWDVLSGDFDETLTPNNCYLNVIKHAETGSIVVFHDSTKAWERMSYALPLVLAYYTQKGYQFKALPV